MGPHPTLATSLMRAALSPEAHVTLKRPVSEWEVRPLGDGAHPNVPDRQIQECKGPTERHPRGSKYFQPPRGQQTPPPVEIFS